MNSRLHQRPPQLGSCRQGERGYVGQKYVVIVAMDQELYPLASLGTKVINVLHQSESVVRQSSRNDTRDIRRR